MTHYTATVHLIFDVDHGETDIPDALNAILTEDMRKYSRADSCLIDWAFAHGDAAAAIAAVDVPADYEPDDSPFPMPADTVRDAAPDVLTTLRDMRAAYGRLHDFLADAIEGGRLNESHLPDDYAAICDALAKCGEADHFAGIAVAKAEGRT